MPVQEITISLLGNILFFLPGLLLTFLLFRKLDIVERLVYSLVLGAAIATILSVILHHLNYLNVIPTLGLWLGLSLTLFIVYRVLRLSSQTTINKDVWYIALFAVLGTAWRYFFLRSIKNIGDAYSYSVSFESKIPDLEFYTGMAVDHSNYLGVGTSDKVYQLLAPHSSLLSLFLIVFVYLGLIYLVFRSFQNQKLAYLGVALFSLGPIEIFHTTLTITGHPLSYVMVFALFLYFKSKKPGMLWMLLLMAVTSVLTYYTASIVLLLSCAGFALAVYCRNLLEIKNFLKATKATFTDTKFIVFVIVGIFVALHVTFLSNMLKYTMQLAQTNPPLAEPIQMENFGDIAPISHEKSFLYKDPPFFGLSAIGWQSLFFLLCGFSFLITSFFNRERFKQNIDLLVCLIPVAIVSFSFIYAKYPTRLFDYFAFFGLLWFALPKKYLKTTFVTLFIFMALTSFVVANQRKMYFTTSSQEIEGARWIKQNLDEKLFTDQTFVNSLVLQGFHKVSGDNDDTPLVYSLFYQDDPKLFLRAIDFLKHKKKVSYIALTDKMMNKYILMVNHPQIPLTNKPLYDEHLVKIFDNDGVKVYQIK